MDKKKINIKDFEPTYEDDIIKLWDPQKLDVDMGKPTEEENREAINFDGTEEAIYETRVYIMRSLPVTVKDMERMIKLIGDNKEGEVAELLKKKLEKWEMLVKEHELMEIYFSNLLEQEAIEKITMEEKRKPTKGSSGMGMIAISKGEFIEKILDEKKMTEHQMDFLLNFQAYDYKHIFKILSKMNKKTKKIVVKIKGGTFIASLDENKEMTEEEYRNFVNDFESKKIFSILYDMEKIAIGTKEYYEKVLNEKMKEYSEKESPSNDGT